jgi:hypothetical protein
MLGKPKEGWDNLKHYFSAGAQKVHMDEESTRIPIVPVMKRKASRWTIKGMQRIWRLRLIGK